MNIPITKAIFDKEEKEAILKPLGTGWVVQGPNVAKFQDMFADFTGAKYAHATTSCTTALHLGLEAIGIGIAVIAVAIVGGIASLPDEVLLESPTIDTSENLPPSNVPIVIPPENVPEIKEIQEPEPQPEARSEEKVTIEEPETDSEPFEGIETEDIKKYADLYDEAPPESDSQARVLAKKIRKWISDGRPST